MFFVLYALIGIPMCLVFLAGVGERLAMVNERIARTINLCSQYPKLEKVVDSLIIVLFGLGFLVIIPAILFSVIEDGWGVDIGIYYVLTSLSTVGFGDYVAGK